ncbi:hypothetical protein EDI_013700 [Entamoeba dispar SAW760]|uniref:Uncharacterized protein n=1 Tax=Entamoeba dispar (strain ATCC PRA-260 / SAW760) TaxID=370354 RepID=B0E5Q4_ENTDS|nr:uncharacterized protein EDI_013700 [Entamoeba dispar SAW760]EDR30150.1 hypothetical protein EDI_013700 [Entamoeba dispar SAW760]|eukprot:EDR30150.1 hypothetical protein EDI_013700 [Entamoeba dispar SAW760]
MQTTTNQLNDTQNLNTYQYNYQQPVYSPNTPVCAQNEYGVQPVFREETNSTSVSSQPRGYTQRKHYSNNERNVVICFFLGFILFIPFLVAYIIGKKSKSKGIKLLATISFLCFAVYFFALIGVITVTLILLN